MPSVAEDITPLTVGAVYALEVVSSTFTFEEVVEFSPVVAEGVEPRENFPPPIVYPAISVPAKTTVHKSTAGTKPFFEEGPFLLLL